MLAGSRDELPRNATPLSHVVSAYGYALSPPVMAAVWAGLRGLVHARAGDCIALAAVGNNSDCIEISLAE